MKQKTVREIKRIMSEIYGEDYFLMSKSEIIQPDTSEVLWNTLRFKKIYSKEEVSITYIQFEDIGYTTNEYNELGEQPSDFTKWDLLDEKLGVKND